MQPPHILYIITSPEDKILHHILWNQQQRPKALFAVVAMNPTVDQWLQQQKVECSLIHGDLPYSPQRLEEFHQVMQGSLFQDFTIPGSDFAFAQNIPVDRLLQFFEYESRHKEQEVLDGVKFDEMVCSLDMHHPIIHFLAKKCIKLGILTTAIQCSDIRTREMLDVSLLFNRYILDLDEDKNFLVRELGIDADKIEVVGKSLYDAFVDMKDQVRKASKNIAAELHLTDHDRGVFMPYIRRHNWEIRRFLRVLIDIEHENPDKITLFVHYESDADREEFQVLFDEELSQIKWHQLPGQSDITILNHCFPFWLAFRWNRDLEIASRLGQKVIIFDPFDFNCTSRIGIDDMAWSIVRQDNDLRDILYNLPLETVK